MKLLATDYDGTLNTNITNLKINVNYIEKFRKKGHKVMITTGRTFTSIKKQIDRFNISYDYLSCNDGAILFDNNDNLLYADYLNIDNIELLLGRICQLPITKKLNIYGLYSKINSLDKIIEIELKTNCFIQSKALFNLLNEYNLNVIKLLNNYYIENRGGKSRSINYLSQIKKFDEIIVVGDSKNDIDMLVDYNGYRMLCSSLSLYLCHLKTTTSVKSLIKKLI